MVWGLAPQTWTSTATTGLHPAARYLWTTNRLTPPQRRPLSASKSQDPLVWGRARSSLRALSKGQLVGLTNPGLLSATGSTNPVLCTPLLAPLILSCPSFVRIIHRFSPASMVGMDISKLLASPSGGVIVPVICVLFLLPSSCAPLQEA